MKSSRLLLPVALAVVAASAQAQAPQAARPVAPQRALDPVTVTAPRAHDPFSPFVYDVMGLNAPIRIDLIRAWFRRGAAPAAQVTATPAADEAVLTAQAGGGRDAARR